MRCVRLLLALVAGVTVIFGGSVAQAADPLTGRVVDSSSGAPVAGVTVTVYELDTSGGVAAPGDAAGSATTGADGRFAVDVTGAPGVEEFFIHVGGDGHQDGWLNGYGYLADDPGAAATFGASGDLGDIQIFSSTVQGQTVSAADGGPVPLVIVLVYAEDYATILGWDVTDLQGRFVINGIDREEISIRFIATFSGRESGWLACDGSVVATEAQSCTTSPGDQGDVPLDRL